MGWKHELNPEDLRKVASGRAGDQRGPPTFKQTGTNTSCLHTDTIHKPILEITYIQIAERFNDKQLKKKN